MTHKYLTRPEEIILLALWRLRDTAYGVTIRDLVQRMTGRYWSIGSIYVPLERLERKGFVVSEESQPTAERGGRRKRIFHITDKGIQEMIEIQRVNRVIWKGFSKEAVKNQK
jgi:DNA-binding PadR family transcriptional regulator